MHACMQSLTLTLTLTLAFSGDGSVAIDTALPLSGHFHFIYYFTGYEKKQLQNETDIKNANMFK